MYPTWRRMRFRRLADDVVAEAGAAAAIGATSRPHSMRMVVVLPLPLEPRNPQISPFATCRVEAFDHAPRAKTLAQPVDVDDEPGHRPIRAVLLA